MLSQSENFSPNCAQNSNQTNPKKPKILKLIAALIAMLLITLTTSGFIATNSTKSQESKIDVNQIFDSGYDAGFVDGKNAGIPEGYANGTQLGNQTGYIAGNVSGYTQGLNAGYHKGLIDGAGTGYTLRDPSYQEMIDFLAQDKTSEQPYDAEDYNCYDFTRDLCNNASAAGIRIGDVYLEFPDSAHALVCFNTTDNGLVFVEPQNDKVVTLEIGHPYFDRALFKTPEFDDIIVSYGIIW